MAKMKFTSPSTEEQKNYFARSAQLRFWAGILIFVVPLVWAVVDYMGLSGLIMPHNPTVSTVFTVLLLLVFHGILIASAMMASYDIFDNNRVESPIMVVLPILISGGLLYFSWQGAENLYLEYYAHKAVETKTDSLDAKLNIYTTAINTKYDKQKADVKEAKNLARKSVRSRFSGQMSAAQRLAVHDDADRKWRAKKIADVNRDIDNAIATIDNAEADELSTIAKNAAAEAKTYSDSHSTETGSIAAKNNAEREKEQADKQKAEGKGFWFSLGLCILFFLSVIARTRTDCKSGIIPIAEHTDGDKSDRVRETMYVFNAIFGSQYSRFLAWLHDLGATEYREITPIRQKPLVAGPVQQAPTPPPPPFTFTVNPQTPNLGIAAKAKPIGYNRTDDGNVKSVMPLSTPSVQTHRLFASLSDSEKKAIIDSLLNEGGRMIDRDILRDLLIEQNPTTLQLQNSDVRKMLIGESARILSERWEKLSQKHPPTPSVEVQIPILPTVTTNNTATIEAAKTVTTAETPVTTDNLEFSYWDKLIRDFKSDFQKELANLRSKNGTEDSILKRLVKKQKDFDTMIRDSKATPKLKAEISNWVFENISPLVTAFLKGDKEDSNE
jgi:succinate dehydrogenase hydrophobic anchor subunit